MITSNRQDNITAACSVRVVVDASAIGTVEQLRSSKIIVTCTLS